MARRRKGVRLEMTALLDVMFLVLVFFIYSIFDMAVHRGVKVDLPSAAGAEERGDRIVVTILPDDSLQLDGEPLPRRELVDRVCAILASSPARTPARSRRSSCPATAPPRSGRASPSSRS